VYRRRKNADSISKFSLLYETALDTLHNNIRTETIRKMTAMYDYQRFQELAAKKETEARTMWVAFSFAFFALLCLLLILSILVWAYRQNKLHKLQLLTTNLSKTTEDYHLAQHELEMLSSKSDKEQKEKKKEVAQLKEKLNQYIAQLQTIKPTTHITPDNLVIKKFKSKTYYKGNAGKATDGNWRELTELFINALPRTYAFIAREGTLTPLELRVCLLILLNFQNGEIATLLATSSQSITNTKSSANQKLFHDSSASTLLKKLKSYSREHDKV
jgi:DNA-binding CsgD family transcriptional regulator